MPDSQISENIVQIPPRKRMEAIKQGDILLTVATPSSKDRKATNWRHIAIVQSFKKLSSTEGLLSIAKWGEAGEEKHTTENTTKKLHDGSGNPGVFQLLKRR
jgi:hypothetical protein